MRTCPACGKDTKAETSQPCTRCGFSVSAPDEVIADEVTIGGYEAPPPAPAPEPTAAPTGFPAPPAPEPVPQSPTSTGSNLKRGLVWVAIVIAAIAVQSAKAFDGCGAIFESDTGPTAAETEKALEHRAEKQGFSGYTVDCDDAAKDTPVDASFLCNLKSPSGFTDTVVVTNREDKFEWSMEAWYRLEGQEQGA